MSEKVGVAFFRNSNFTQCTAAAAAPATFTVSYPQPRTKESVMEEIDACNEALERLQKELDSLMGYSAVGKS